MSWYEVLCDSLTLELFKRHKVTQTHWEVTQELKNIWIVVLGCFRCYVQTASKCRKSPTLPKAHWETTPSHFGSRSFRRHSIHRLLVIFLRLLGSENIPPCPEGTPRKFNISDFWSPTKTSDQASNPTKCNLGVTTALKGPPGQRKGRSLKNNPKIIIFKGCHFLFNFLM